MSTIVTNALFQDVSDRLKYDTYVETGTASGDSVINISTNSYFCSYTTIELSVELHKKALQRAIERLKPTNVLRNGNSVTITFRVNEKSEEKEKSMRFINGNSKIELPKVLDEIKKPAVILLDAHYCRGSIAADTAKNEFPLWEELKYIKNRGIKDIVGIDDVHTFGKERPDLKDGGSQFVWLEVTPQSILDFMGERVDRYKTIKDTFWVFLKS